MLLATPAGAAERIIALTPHACEMLFAIGAGEDVVGVAEYCDFPAEAERLPRVADARRIYLEAALKLKPTLAVSGSHSISGIDRLKKTGVRIVETHPRRVRDIFVDMRRLGELTGHQKKAEEIVRGLEKRLQVLGSHLSRPVRAFYEVWPDPLMSEGGPSFITDMLKHAGAENIFADSPLESIRVNIESVIRAAPDVIIIPDGGVGRKKRTAFWQHWLGNNVPVIPVDSDLLHRPGPRLIDGIEQLHAKIYRLQVSP